MKQILLFALFAFSLFSQSPVNKGAKGLSGQVLYNSTSSMSDHSSLLDISPAGFCFVSGQLELGLSLTWQRYWEDEVTVTTAGAGPYVNLYLMKEGQVLPFIGAGFNFLERTMSVDVSYIRDRTKTSVLRELNLTVGLLVPLSQSVSLIPMLHHKWYWQDKDNFGDYKEFMIGIGLKTFLN